MRPSQFCRAVELESFPNDPWHKKNARYWYVNFVQSCWSLKSFNQMRLDWHSKSLPSRRLKAFASKCLEACVTSRPFLIIFHREAPTSKQGRRRGKNWKIQLILEVFKIFFRHYFDMRTSAPNDISNLFLCQIQKSPFIITLNDIWPAANENLLGDYGVQARRDFY